MSCAAWFDDFAFKLIQRVPRSDWKPVDDEFWTPWRCSLDSLEGFPVAQEVADEASIKLAQSPPPYLCDQLSAFLGHVRAIWRKSEVHGRAAQAENVASLNPYEDDDRQAYAHWNTLTDDERESWRVRVRRHFGAWLERYPNGVELMACGWAMWGPSEHEGKPLPKRIGELPKRKRGRESWAGRLNQTNAPDVAMVDGRLITLVNGRLPSDTPKSDSPSPIP